LVWEPFFILVLKVQQIIKAELTQQMVILNLINSNI